METNTDESTPMNAPLNDGTVGTSQTMMSIEERLAEAQRDLIEKGESWRRAVVRPGHDRNSSDLAYAAWKRATATVTTIYAEVKAHRERLAVQGAA